MWGTGTDTDRGTSTASPAPPASPLESLGVMLKIELNKHRTSNLGCSHRQTLILTLWESWLHDQGHQCPIPANTAVHTIKPQHVTADEGIISPDTTTALRSSINTMELVWNHFKLVLHLVKAAGWRALEDAAVASEPMCCFRFGLHLDMLNLWTQPVRGNRATGMVVIKTSSRVDEKEAVA